MLIEYGLKNFFGFKEVLKTDNTENGSDNTKEDDSENSKKNCKIF